MRNLLISFALIFGLGAGCTPRTPSPSMRPDCAAESSSDIPLVRVPPYYPRAAAGQGVEGWVLLRLMVRPDGSVRSAEVVESRPRGVFDDAAVTAVSKWHYCPSAEPREVQLRLGFEL